VTAPERLFGVPDSETMWLDLGSAYEQQIEPYLDDEGNRSPKIIEEWSVCPTTAHLRDPRALVDWLLEEAADSAGAEGYYDDTEHLARNPEVVALAEALIAGLASRIAYRVADRRVGEHVITWDENDEPLVAGVRLYVRREPTPESADRTDGVAPHDGASVPRQFADQPHPSPCECGLYGAREGCGG
jgi:hypothetical protein